MATRLRRKALIDPLGDARAALDKLRKRIRNHRQICSMCHTAGEHTERYCDDGWEMAKKESRAIAAVRRCEDAAPPPREQGTLW